MLKDKIEINEVKKIFRNKEDKLEYLEKLYNEKKISSPIPKKLSAVDESIINTWDFQTSNKIIRKMFEKTEKYKIGKFSADAISEMMKQWNNLCLGKLEWPFHPMAFDQHIQDLKSCMQRFMKHAGIRRL